LQIFTTTPVDDLGTAGDLFARLEAAGYDGAFTFETRHDPFLPLAAAAPRTTQLRLGTAIAIAFARTPMLLANIGYDLQQASRGRFVLGLGSQVRPHIRNRYSMPWSQPAARMRELVLAIRAIWDAWDGVAPLEFRGEFYSHTLMTPAFDPGPQPYGRAAIHVAGVGPRMVEVAAEVGDGLMVHPFSTRRSLTELTMPAVERGLRKSGHDRAGFEVTAVCLVATGSSGPELDEAVAVVRKQLAFYGSTPAYAPVLESEGLGQLHRRLNEMSKQQRWDDMAELIPDQLVEAVAIVGRRADIAGAIMTKVGGLADAVSIECTRRPDPALFADIVVDLRALAGRS